MHHRFHNIAYVYFTRIYQGAGKLTQKLKYIRFGKKTHKLITVTWWEKIRSGRYHNDNIFQKTYTVTKRNLNEQMFWTFVHVFTLSWWKKPMLTFCYKFCFALSQSFKSLVCENLFIMRFGGCLFFPEPKLFMTRNKNIC